MKIKEMIEMIKLHHPHVRETEAKKLIKNDQDTTAKTRYYPLDDDILEIKSVQVSGEEIPRMIGGLNLEDDDTTGGNVDGG